jgi:hypothetical protein
MNLGRPQLALFHLSLACCMSLTPLSAHGQSLGACRGAERASPQVLVAAALRVAGYLRALPSWRTRARWAGLLPRLSVRLARGTGAASYFDLRPDAPDGWDANARTSLTFEARASWQLDRLVFDRREIAASEALRREQRARHRLSRRVIELYFTYRQLEQLLDSGARTATETASVTRQRQDWLNALRKTEALLEQLTGGVFCAARPDVPPSSQGRGGAG